LGVAYWRDKQFDKSVPTFEKALQGQLKARGKDHPETFKTAFNLGVNYRSARLPDDAVKVFDEWLPRAAKALPADHDVLDYGQAAGAETYSIYVSYGKLPEAIRLFEEVLKRREKKMGTKDPDTLEVLGNLASTYSKAGEHDKSALLLEDELSRRVASQGK